MRQGQTLCLEKLAALYTSRDSAISECGLEARKSILQAAWCELTESPKNPVIVVTCCSQQVDRGV
jgi:hypothetical protein